MFKVLFVAAAIVLLAGCEDESATLSNAQGVGVQPTQSGSTTLWSQGKVEKWLRDGLHLKSISLSSTGGGNYQGTGEGEDGRAYTLKVKQVTGGIACNWSDGVKGSGQMGVGNKASGEP